MTDAQIEQAIKLRANRDEAFTLANKVANYGIYMLERDDLRKVLNSVSEEDMRTIKNILTNSMLKRGEEYAEALKKI